MLKTYLVWEIQVGKPGGMIARFMGDTWDEVSAKLQVLVPGFNSGTILSVTEYWRPDIVAQPLADAIKEAGNVEDSSPTERT